MSERKVVSISDVVNRLREPFPASDIQWRIGMSGVGGGGKPWAKALAYLDARAVMDRLDETVGPHLWQDEYSIVGDGIMCTLSIYIDGNWIRKCGMSDTTDIEAVKGGESGALKRAAVKWGVGRYLYNLTETFVECSKEKGRDLNYAKGKGGVFYWKTPSLPSWALPNTNMRSTERVDEVPSLPTPNEQKREKTETVVGHAEALEKLKNKIMEMTKNGSDTSSLGKIKDDLKFVNYRDLEKKGVGYLTDALGFLNDMSI